MQFVPRVPEDSWGRSSMPARGGEGYQTVLALLSDFLENHPTHSPLGTLSSDSHLPDGWGIACKAVCRWFLKTRKFSLKVNESMNFEHVCLKLLRIFKEPWAYVKWGILKPLKARKACLISKWHTDEICYSVWIWEVLVNRNLQHSGRPLVCLCGQWLGCNGSFWHFKYSSIPSFI